MKIISNCPSTMLFRLCWFNPAARLPRPQEPAVGHGTCLASSTAGSLRSGVRQAVANRWLESTCSMPQCSMPATPTDAHALPREIMIRPRPSRPSVTIHLQFVDKIAFTSLH